MGPTKSTEYSYSSLALLAYPFNRCLPSIDF